MPKKQRRDMTEWWLTYLGPAQVGNIRGPRKVLTDDEVARDTELQQQFDRVVDAARPDVPGGTRNRWQHYW